MRWGFAGLGALLVGFMTFIAIFMFLDATIVNEEDYYLLKEALEASMYDSIDVEYYQRTGEIKIIQEKLVEDFSRRLSETSAFSKEGYTLGFYDIIESPPKVTARIYGKTGEYQLSLDSDEFSSYDILNELDGILLYRGDHFYSYDRYIINENPGDLSKVTGLNNADLIKPSEIKDSSNCKIRSIEYTKAMTNRTELNTFYTYYKEWYKAGSSAYLAGENNKDLLNTASNNEDKFNDNFCQIDYLTKFDPQYNKSHVFTRLDSPTVSAINCDGKKLIGLKYKVTWRCTTDE